ncbi:protein of unknown function DUF1351 [Desulfovibrio sp. X2]|uniref:DUF1351 domain-containing protein n=1 Tax=Desulfovibrio sp. X2 TaxID=941449 RepID=UPI0003589A8A|nr:DUF1351 domain-containing protein [Desulfovibrio sp. X2]EPR42690.1 protein of unknown function DUF1351 [Desulfovibrio sp. X2]
MEDIKLTTTLPAISFDFDGLKAFAEGIVEQYRGLIVQEDQIAGIKSEMAGLNKLKKQIDDARKETVRQVSAPVKEFEGKIKEICAIFDEAYGFLGGQVKAFEDRAREDKRHEVQVIIDHLRAEHGVQPLDIPVEDRWLNKTTKLKDVQSQIEAIILDHLKAEKDKAALEQARRDRAVFIEEKCASLGNLHGFLLPASSFLHLQDMDISMQDAAAQIETAYAQKAKDMADAARQAEEAQARAARKDAAQPAATPCPTSRPQPVTTSRPSAQRVVRTITIEYYATREVEIASALKTLAASCISLADARSRAA